jgi:hypothetical protein
VRYEMNRPPARPPVRGPRQDHYPTGGTHASDGQLKGLLSALRRLMFGGKKDGRDG